MAFIILQLWTILLSKCRYYTPEPRFEAKSRNLNKGRCVIVILKPPYTTRSFLLICRNNRTTQQKSLIIYRTCGGLNSVCTKLESAAKWSCSHTSSPHGRFMNDLEYLNPSFSQVVHPKSHLTEAFWWLVRSFRKLDTLDLHTLI